ncbi:MAG: TraB/GumN family protein [ANME-2 cluster archaeon]|nr:TraB/GumN family protein [ANME-2 cluster archaeon]
MNSKDKDFNITYSVNISQSKSGHVPISDNPIDNIIIVGTAHVSDKSVTEVDQTIERERPDVVAVELCPARYQALTEQVETKKISPKDILGGSKPYYFLVHWLLAYVQKKIGDDMGVDPGAEMLQAIKKAESIGARIALVDRDIQVTLQRFWNSMSLWEKIKMTGAILMGAVGLNGKEIDIDSITDQDVVTQLVEELRNFAPSAARVFIDERDAYIASNLLQAAKTDRVVAVVGAGHRQGINNYLQHPETLSPMEQLVSVPKKRFNVMKIVGVSFVAIAIATFLLVIIGIMQGAISPYIFLIAMGYWFIINGVLSAAGAALARGHPKSILTAFSVAWLTSLNPMMAAGWFAGLMEAKQRPPSTDDFRTILEAETVDEMLNNRLFRVLLVAALANLGSVLGTFIGVYVVLSVAHIDPTLVLKEVFGSIFG